MTTDNASRTGQDWVRVPYCWLVRAGGERYDTWLCRTEEDVRNALCEALYGVVQDADAEDIDNWMKWFRDPKEWDGGHEIHEQLEDGSIGIVLLNEQPLAAAPAVSPVEGEVAPFITELRTSAYTWQKEDSTTAQAAFRRETKAASLLERLWREKEGLANEAEEHLLRANQEQGKRIAAESSLASAHETIEKLRQTIRSLIHHWTEFGPEGMDEAIHHAAKQTPEASGG